MQQLVNFTRRSIVGRTMFAALPSNRSLFGFSLQPLPAEKCKALSSRHEQASTRRYDTAAGGWGANESDKFSERRGSNREAGPSQKAAGSRWNNNPRPAEKGGRQGASARTERQRQGGSDWEGTRSAGWQQGAAGRGDDNDDDGDSHFSGDGGSQDSYQDRREEDRRPQRNEEDRRPQRNGGYGERNWGYGEREQESWRARKEQREKQPTIRDELFGEVLYGVAPVVAALKTKRRTAHVLYLQDSMDMSKRKDARAVQDAVRLAEASGAAVRRVGKHELNLLSDDRPHQGLILDCSPLKWEPLDTFPAAFEASTSAQHPIWLALDEVVDPQNLGAVIRSAYCLGATGVVASAKNCAPLSAVVSKASAGSLEAMQLHSTRNMARALVDAAATGWAVLGASGDRQSQPLNDLVVDRPTILVMGNEGYGLRTNVRRACTGMVRIEMGAGGSGQWSSLMVDSLNVSVATGILLHHLIASARASSKPDLPLVDAIQHEQVVADSIE